MHAVADGRQKFLKSRPTQASNQCFFDIFSPELAGDDSVAADGLDVDSCRDSRVNITHELHFFARITLRLIASIAPRRQAFSQAEIKAFKSRNDTRIRP